MGAEAELRLSPTQTHLGRLSGQDPPVAFTARLCLEIRGRLDGDRLELALGDVIERHEILRTRFTIPSSGSPATMTIDEPGDFGLSRSSVEVLTPALQQREIERLFDDFPNRIEPNDGTGNLAPLSALLLEVSTDDHLLFVDLPSLAADTVALDNLAREIVLAYGRRLGVGTPPLLEPLQYRDLAEWMADCLVEDTARSELALWRRRWPPGRRPTHLTPLPPPLARDVAATAGETRETRVPTRIDLPLPSTVPPELEALAHRLELPSESLVLAGWAVLAGRLSRSPEVLLGIVAPGRTYDELDDAIGLLARTLPLTVTLDESEPFVELARRVDEGRAEIADAETVFPWHEASPSSAAGRERREPHLALGFEATTRPPLPELPGLHFEIERRRARIDYFEIELIAERRDERLALGFEYDPRRFRHAEMERLAGRLVALLTNVCADVERPLGALDCLSDAERRLLVTDFNDTVVDYDTGFDKDAGFDSDAGRTILERIERQIAERPGEPAVICGERSLSYEELGARAHRIARLLRRQGVGPGVCVAVSLERSVELVTGILGALAAGGAYVPLDPAYPADRLAYMLADSGAPVLLTQEHLAAKLARHGVQTLSLDSEDAALDAAGEAPPANAAVGPQDPAYVIYTSGSSGRPKGVMVDHHHLAHSTLARIHYYREPIERFLLLASCSFDSSVAGIFWALAEGAVLVLPREGLQQDPQAIAELIAEHEITHMLSLPALYETILDRGEAGTRLDSLRTLVLHGEVFSGELTHRHYRHLPACRLYNEYGPTEDSVWSTVYEIDPEITSGQIPIGEPIPNTTVYVVDEALRLAPLGVPGELLLGGAGIARGYLGQPALTAERFVPDPYAGEPGARLYRTGDLARFREDGNLDFLGRVDEQIKIRGYRIEPVEVEIALTEHASIRQVVAMARRRASGALQLVAYVVREPGATVREAELRRFLGERLPEFMLPSVLVFLDALPLMPNGKIDKHALPEPSEVRPDLDQAYVAPDGEIERFLAESWSEILGIRRIGVRDNFFELGGDSIQAAILMNRVRDRFGDAVGVATLFRQPTIAGLAEALMAAAEVND